MNTTDHRLAFHHRLVLAVARAWLTLRHRRLIRAFRRVHGYLPDPAHPHSYVEKILWRKIFDRDPRFVTFTDKLASKAYVAERAPTLPIPSTLWTGTSIAAAPGALLEGPVIVKVNNGWASNIMVERGKPTLAELVPATTTMMTARRRKDEWAYLPISPRLFIEEQLPLDHGTLPTDIKVYMACGVPANVWTVDKVEGRSLTLAPDGSPSPGRDSDYPRDDQALPHSPALAKLVREAVVWSKLLAADVDFLRVDFLVSGGRLYAGELTVYSSSGTERLANAEQEQRLARLWDLRESHFLKQRHRSLTALYVNALRAAETQRLGSHSPNISKI
ncbi:ATP-grasp fold amidoligase family protein [Devosia sp. A16]|uniref:ATP-grasp fold amidoligase family protein n=1 Tax=Devosia sp. A16 TaxID=1736675 RepID=UPI0006D7E0AC|nr:ATP-grasp fold amidoligase family protein [Devosia sp. A16]